MLTQKEFVEGCLSYYREADLQPGNPEDGDWNVAHYPVPECKKGTETILLLREHHAVQGVLQSEEFQWKCVWGWEEEFLSGEYLKLLKKWQSEGQRLWQAQKTEEEKRLTSEKIKASWAQRTEEEKRLTAEKKRASALAQHARLTEEEKLLRCEKIKDGLAQVTEEEKALRSERSKVGQARRIEEEKRLCPEKRRASALAWHAQKTEEEKALFAEKCRARALVQNAQMSEEEKLLRSEKCRSSALAWRERQRFEKEVDDLVAVWEMGLRWG